MEKTSLVAFGGSFYGHNVLNFLALVEMGARMLVGSRAVSRDTRKV